MVEYSSLYTSIYIHLFTLQLLLYCTCVLGDLIVQNTHSPLLKAAADSCCHGTVAVFSWCLVVIGTHVTLFEVAVCGLLAMIVDLDHFWMAGSLSLKVSMGPPL